jgi:anti-sigma factor NepR-like protein
MNCLEYERPDKRDDVVRHEARPNAGLNLKAVRGIGAALRMLHSDVLDEEVPDRMAELLRNLDQQRDAETPSR